MKQPDYVRNVIARLAHIVEAARSVRVMAPDITVAALTGRLALERECQHIETLLDDLVKRGSLRVIFDMRAWITMDSAGIGMLALATGKLKEAGGLTGRCGARTRAATAANVKLFLRGA